MILSSAHYRLLQGEEEWFDADEAVGWHQLDGEIRLNFSNAPSAFISWQSQPVVYSIGLGVRSYFPYATLRQVEMSAHVWWSSLVGREVRLDFVDSGHQILRISTDSTNIFLSSQYDDGMFQGDCVRVSLKEPAL